MRVIFLGTPEFAVPSLRALAREHEVVAVFTQPDRPKGRGNTLAQSPVKMAALDLSLPIHQPERLRRAPTPDLLRGLTAEIMIVVGYGQIIPQSIIDMPRRGILNVHASLLPRYRGAAPIQWAIANGESETGVTIMQIDAGLDTGDMLLKRSVAIDREETALELSARLAPLGAEALLQTMDQLKTGTAVAEKQNDADATYAPILKKEDGLIDWDLPAQNICNRLRGFTPWPGVYSRFRQQQLLIWRARAVEHVTSLQPGRMLVEKRRVLVGCGESSTLEVAELQLPGKNRMNSEAFINGYQPLDNETLGDLP